MVLDTDQNAPQSVQWFAYTLGSTNYTGGGSFGDPSNPGFEGVATPEPESLLLGFFVLGAIVVRYVSFGK